VARRARVVDFLHRRIGQPCLAALGLGAEEQRPVAETRGERHEDVLSVSGESDLTGDSGDSVRSIRELLGAGAHHLKGGTLAAGVVELLWKTIERRASQTPHHFAKLLVVHGVHDGRTG